MAVAQVWREWAKKQRRYESWQRRIYNNLSSRTGECERRELEALAEDFFRFARPAGALLEIGCGAGRAAARLPGVRYFGVDPLVLRTNHGLRFCQAVGEKLPFKDDSFDSIIALAVLDHVADLDEVLSESRRVLKPGGRFSAMNQILPEGQTISYVWQLVCRAVGKLGRGDFTVIPRSLYFLLWREDIYHMRRFTRGDLMGNFGAHFAEVTTRERGKILYVQASK